MNGSKREDNEDHYVYFGSAKEMNGRIVNDVVCSKDDDFADQHFYIRYDKCKFQFSINTIIIIFRQEQLYAEGPGTGLWHVPENSNESSHCKNERHIWT